MCKEYKCIFCENSFDSNRGLSVHFRYKHKSEINKLKNTIVKSKCLHCKKIIKNTKYNHLFNNNKILCNRSCSALYNNTINSIKTIETICLFCKTKIKCYSSHPKKYCNSSCKFKYTIKNDKKNNKNLISYKCYNCKKIQKVHKQERKTKYCSQKCFLAKNNSMFSSKIERDIVKEIKRRFPLDEWKSGGGLIYNNLRFSRDLYSDKLKICFEYDGIWHFKDIHGQLEFKKNKDFLLEQWCLENNYRLIRIEDKYYKNIDQIINLIYKRKTKIIKIGKSYK